jgi:hypothetical protein
MTSKQDSKNSSSSNKTQHFFFAKSFRQTGLFTAINKQACLRIVFKETC